MQDSLPQRSHCDGLVLVLWSLSTSRRSLRLGDSPGGFLVGTQ